MNLYPLIGIGLGAFFKLLHLEMVAKRMNKDMPSLGELMYPMHHRFEKDKINQRKAKLAEKSKH